VKVVIIGGGIAGLTLGILLLRKKLEVVICEKTVGIQHKGHAFLMSSDGLNILKELFVGSTEPLLFSKVQQFSLKRPNGDELIKIKLDSWQCMKRKSLMATLNSSVDETIMRRGYSFSHFAYKDGKATAAIFENGEIEYGDVFIGADGSNSKVRDALFGAVEFTPVEVKEVVSIAKKSSAITDGIAKFQKFQSKDKGIAFGNIPVSTEEVVWFMQYDSKFSNGEEHKSAENLKSFCFELLKDFPQEVKEILRHNDFTNSYVWNTRDFDILPTFHKNNIAIIGDAAHLALPFTSSGTTNAILDAKCISEHFDQDVNLESIFSNYYKERSGNLAAQLEEGRELKKIFLNPELHSERGFILPLISDQDKTQKPKVDKQLKISYFTDPVCSTCWIMQPVLRKLILDYEEYIQINYHMGGLLPSWVDFNRGGLKTPSDLAEHWDEESKNHDTPINGEIWKEDPLQSSFPPSIAFKAAQLQNHNKSVMFFRRLKEMLFIEKQNIAKWEFIEKAALHCGLDSALLLNDISGKARELFEQDLILTAQKNVTAFPTFIFTLDGESKFSLSGSQSYIQFEEIIRLLIPDVQKKFERLSPIGLFQRYNNMTSKEFAFLSSISLEEGENILVDLLEKGVIEQLIIRSGIVWMYKNVE